MNARRAVCGVVLCLVWSCLAEPEAKRTNKFMERQDPGIESVVPGMVPPKTHNAMRHRCASSMQILWSTELESSVYATPVIVDIDGDGQKEIIVSTYAQFIDVLDAKTGHSKPGWPFTLSGSTFHGSPLVGDVDGDGSLEIVTVSFNAEVLVLGKEGLPYLSKVVNIPKLKVKKEWYKSKSGFDDGVSITEAGRVSDGERGELQQKLKQGIHSHHAHSAPILPLSDNNEEATVSMPFTSFGIHSFQELFDTVQGVESSQTAQNTVFEENGYVLVDSHVLASPVLFDLDGDGVEELIVAVSYFFDRDSFDYDAFAASGSDIELSKYVAGGVVVIDLRDASVKWSLQLDLETESSPQRPYMYSTPTVSDLDGDSHPDIIVGTSMGYVYVLDFNGQVREGWPIEMGEVQGQVAVLDVQGDGKLDLIVCDSNANVAAFDCNGDEIWNTQIAGLSAHGAMFADVDGDSKLDIVITTSLGLVYALNAEDGSLKKNFPIKFEQRVISPVLPIRKTSTVKHHNLIVPVFDGKVYVIDPTIACMDFVDLGEHSYTQVLADDLLGTNEMALIVTTMNGGVYCLGTSIRYSPLRSWQSQNLLFNWFAPREGWVGIRVSEESRSHQDIVGSAFALTFDIVDERPLLPETVDNVAYTVKVRVGGLLLHQQDFVVSGVHTVVVPTPPSRMHATVVVELWDEHSTRTKDSFSASFNVNFHKTMKWMVVGPFLLAGTAMMFVKDLKTPLPMY